jgi:hypothetical protein
LENKDKTNGKTSNIIKIILMVGDKNNLFNTIDIIMIDKADISNKRPKILGMVKMNLMIIKIKVEVEETIIINDIYIIVSWLFTHIKIIIYQISHVIHLKKNGIRY